MRQTMETTIRRSSCPFTVQYIWDCMAALIIKRQRPDTDKIFRFLNQKFCMTMGEVKQQLRHAIRDNLIDRVFRAASRGDDKGTKVESYCFHNEEMVRDGHDWYCFECHRSGEVYSCGTCFRVYHPICVNEDLSSIELFMCPVCKLLKRESILEITKDDLNVILGSMCSRLQEISKGNMLLIRNPSKLKKFAVNDEGKLHCQRNNMSSEQLPLNEGEWRQRHLIYSYVDLAIMSQKTAAYQYERLEEFQVDAQTIFHNVVIYNGVDSSYAKLARQMLSECNSNLTVMQQCSKCYKVENEKALEFWFWQPCNPPHELVYAKQPGDTYWPAKVIGECETTYDLQIFRDSHERPNMDILYIEHMSTSINSRMTKGSSASNGAIEELETHFEILDRFEEEPISCVRLEMTSNSISDNNEDSINLGQRLQRANKSDQDKMDAATPSHAAVGLKCRTGNWKPKASRPKLTEQLSSSRGQEDLNQRLASLRQKIETGCNATKEAALHELEMKMDKGHSEAMAILKNNLKKKRKRLKKQLKVTQKKKSDALKAEYRQNLSSIEQLVRQLIEDN